MPRLFVGFLVVVAVLSTSSPVVSAEGNLTVSVSGESVKVFDPDRVRVRWRVYAHGMTASSALKKLASSRAALKKRISQLEDPRPEHQFGKIIEHAPKQGGIEAVQVRLFQNIVGGGGADEKEGDEKLVRLAFTATMDWKLAGTTLPERHREVDRIREQLEEMRVCSGDEREVDRREEESEAEARTEDEDGDDDAAVKIRIADGPTFFYVRQLSAEEVDHCAQLAFKDAEQKATRLAKAAGRQLGPLTRLSDQGPRWSALDRMKNRSVTVDEMFGSSRPTFDEDEVRPESVLVSETFKPIPYRAHLSAVFSVK